MIRVFTLFFCFFFVNILNALSIDELIATYINASCFEEKSNAAVALIEHEFPKVASAALRQMVNDDRYEFYIDLLYAVDPNKSFMSLSENKIFDMQWLAFIYNYYGIRNDAYFQAYVNPQDPLRMAQLLEYNNIHGNHNLFKKSYANVPYDKPSMQMVELSVSQLLFSGALALDLKDAERIYQSTKSDAVRFNAGVYLLNNTNNLSYLFLFTNLNKFGQGATSDAAEILSVNNYSNLALLRTIFKNYFLEYQSAHPIDTNAIPSYLYWMARLGRRCAKAESNALYYNYFHLAIPNLLGWEKKYIIGRTLSWENEGICIDTHAPTIDKFTMKYNGDNVDISFRYHDQFSSIIRVAFFSHGTLLYSFSAPLGSDYCIVYKGDQMLSFRHRNVAIHEELISTKIHSRHFDGLVLTAWDEAGNYSAYQISKTNGIVFMPSEMITNLIPAMQGYERTAFRLSAIDIRNSIAVKTNAATNVIYGDFADFINGLSFENDINNEKIRKLFLEDVDFAPSEKDVSVSDIYDAIYLNDLKMLKQLAAETKQRILRDEFGRTPLSIARRLERSEMVRFLIESGYGSE